MRSLANPPGLFPTPLSQPAGNFSRRFLPPTHAGNFPGSWLLGLPQPAGSGQGQLSSPLLGTRWPASWLTPCLSSEAVLQGLKAIFS